MQATTRRYTFAAVADRSRMVTPDLPGPWYLGRVVITDHETGKSWTHTSTVARRTVDEAMSFIVEDAREIIKDGEFWRFREGYHPAIV